MANYLWKKGNIRDPTSNAIGAVCLDIVAAKFGRLGEGIDQQIKELTAIRDF